MAGLAVAASALFGAVAASAVGVNVNRYSIQAAGALLQTPARAYYGCTQEDAPALMIRLESPAKDAAPVEIEISGAEGATLPLRIMLSPLRRQNTTKRIFARAAYRGVGEPRFLSGEVIITTLERDRRVAGSYKITMPDGADAISTFDAEWNADRVVCGG